MNDKLTILFVEDNSDSVQPVIRLLQSTPVYQCEVKDFGEEEAAIEASIPDIVVLDLTTEGRDGERETPGLAIMDRVWEHRFCPVVVYTAYPEVFVEHRDHPFVEVVQKGARKEHDVQKAIENFRPHVEAMRGVEANIRRQFATAVRDVVPTAFNVFPEDSDFEKRNDIITRLGRRRLAALMDELSRRGEPLASWEQYLTPPISGDIRLGDILRRRGGPQGIPNSYFVVLAPSCDLDTSRGQSPKVDRILVARCCSFKEGLQSTSRKDIKKPKKIKELIEDILPRGYFENIVPIPALPGHFPRMVANLRKLGFVPLNRIRGNTNVRFDVVASVDSPFRELFAWAYMRIACRPGLPDRDYGKWCEEIQEDFAEVAGGAGTE